MKTRGLKSVLLVLVLSCMLAFCGYVFGFYGWTLVYIELEENQQKFSAYLSLEQQASNQGSNRSLQPNDPSKNTSLETLHELMAKIAICR